MLFTLEALEAKHGDCLLLHYGDPGAPKTMLVDGGPSGVYAARLAPRLRQLAESRANGGPLRLRLIIVSHVDDDHVRGVLDLTDRMIAAESNGDDAPVEALGLWHNSFDDRVRRATTAVAAEARSTLSTAAAGDGVPAGLERWLPPESRLVLASIAQGRRLAENARKIPIPQNATFADGLIVAPTGRALAKQFEPGLEILVVGPRQEQLDALQDDWAKWVAQRRAKGKLTPSEVMQAATADFLDKSVYNLSSLVLLVRAEGKTMLLTGDARGDYVLQALHESGLKAPGKPLKVDLLKVPHHGSWRNVDAEFFRQIVARHYVISADGEYENPDTETVESIVDARGNARYTLHLTNRRHVKTGRVLPAAAFLDAHAPKVTVRYGHDRDREQDPAVVPSVVVNLGRARLRD